MQARHLSAFIRPPGKQHDNEPHRKQQTRFWFRYCRYARRARTSFVSAVGQGLEQVAGIKTPAAVEIARRPAGLDVGFVRSSGKCSDQVSAVELTVQVGVPKASVSKLFDPDALIDGIDSAVQVDVMVKAQSPIKDSWRFV